MMDHPMEVRDVIQCHGPRYAYWRLREIAKVGRLHALYLMWVARGLK